MDPNQKGTGNYEYPSICALASLTLLLHLQAIHSMAAAAPVAHTQLLCCRAHNKEGHSFSKARLASGSTWTLQLLLMSMLSSFCAEHLKLPARIDLVP